MKRKVYYHDTDCGGVVYYANYLKFFEEGRTDFMEQAGFSVPELAQKNCLMMVHHQEVWYKHPAKYGDTLDVETYAVELSPVRIVFECFVKKADGTLLVQGVTDVVCVNQAGQLSNWPQEIMNAIAISPKKIKVRRF